MVAYISLSYSDGRPYRNQILANCQLEGINICLGDMSSGTFHKKLKVTRIIYFIFITESSYWHGNIEFNSSQTFTPTTMFPRK